jgi:cob(I)alamin adenosyltransferase
LLGGVQLENASENSKSGKKKRGLVYLYTGEGEGKTTNAFGMAMRAVGHGYKVVVVQFMKGRGNEIGEYRIQSRLKPEYEVHQFGRKEFIDFKNPTPRDYELARAGLEFAEKALESKPKLLILDEINLAVHFNILPLNMVLKFLETIPPGTTVILTGRRATAELFERADLVTQMTFVKHPYEKGVIARKGVEF